MTAEHNHPPNSWPDCCCEADDHPEGSNERIDCPACPEHGTLAAVTGDALAGPYTEETE